MRISHFRAQNGPFVLNKFFLVQTIIIFTYLLAFFIMQNLKKITHIWRRWGTPQNCLLAFINELWKTWKIGILRKWKKIAGDIIILCMCTKNHNYMRYSSWDMKWDRSFCHFGPFFALSPPPGDVIILNLSNKKHNHTMYAYSDMECDRHNFLSF